PRPIGPIGSCLEAEVFGAPEYLRCTNFVSAQPMRDLTGIGRDALEVHQRHKCFETRIGRSRAVGFDAHGCSPGRGRWRQACCGDASSGGWDACGSDNGIPPWPSPAATKLDAMCWPNRARPVACEPSLAVEVPPALWLLTGPRVTVPPSVTVTVWLLM